MRWCDAQKMTSTKSKILIVDDDKELLSSCAKLLRSNEQLDVVTCDGRAPAEAEIQRHEFDLIISDLSMPDGTGLELLNVAKNVSPETPFVIFSAYGNVEHAVEAMRDGAFDFIEKPFKAERLRIVVEKSLQLRALMKEKNDLEEKLVEKEGLAKEVGTPNIVGTSPAIRRVLGMVSQVAETGANVTVIGESGTGKELVARSVHAASARKDKPFVPVNCGAFPPELFESELFGYEKGAFTGAYRSKPGLLEFADGGTFFLDEVCELSLPLQVKLLRTLQERTIRRVGGTELKEIDVRIISASNQDLEKAVEDGTLREDLYYRLNVINIPLPPLRERTGDIPLLSEHFLSKYSKLSPKKINGISADAMRCLERYNWPGNVRELENVVERAVTLTTAEWIRPGDLPGHIARRQDRALAVEMDLPFKEVKEKLIHKFEKEYLLQMLDRHNGNVTHAAECSGIDRRTFHRLLSRHQIDSRHWKDA